MIPVLQFHFSKARVRIFHRFQMLTFQANLKEFWGSCRRFLPPFSLFHTGSWGKPGKRLQRRLFCKYSKWARQISQIKQFFFNFPTACWRCKKRVHLCADFARVKLVEEKALISRVQRLLLKGFCCWCASLVSAVSLPHRLSCVVEWR